MTFADPDRLIAFLGWLYCGVSSNSITILQINDIEIWARQDNRHILKDAPSPIYITPTKLES
jgi:hypothetical protein